MGPFNTPSGSIGDTSFSNMGLTDSFMKQLQGVAPVVTPTSQSAEQSSDSEKED